MSVVNPVKVDISVEDQVLTRDGTYSSCFITEEVVGDQRTYIVYEKSELLDIGFTTESSAYGFADLYFGQVNKPPYLVIRIKNPDESYIDSYLSESNSDFMYVAIESKLSTDIDSFSEFIESQNKLFFTSSNDLSLYDALLNRKNTVFVLSGSDSDVPLLISCDGATNETGVFELSGTFDVELNGQVVATNLEPQALVDYLNGTGDLEVEVIPESIVADYDSFYQTMTVTGRVGLAVETKDSNNIILGSGIIGSDGTVTYALNITDQVSNTPIYTKSELSNTVSHSLVIPIDTSWDIEYVVDGVATRVKAANQYGDIPDNYIDQNAVIRSATSLTINRTVRSVGSYGFRDCTMLTSLVLPTSLEIIYNSSFKNLTSLVSLVIPEGVTDLYPDAFAGCSSLKTIIVPSTMLNMHSGCFDNCFVCESITLHAVTPPTLSYPIFANNEIIAIYVPAESVDVYKSANYWSGYSSRIFAIP